MLLAEDWRGNLRITQLQSRAQFSMWAVMASPLIISANIRNMSKMNIETYTNSEVIAVDQDPLGIQGERVVGGDLDRTKCSATNVDNCVNVWVRKLSGGRAAVVFINVGPTAASSVACDAACLTQTGLAGKAVTVRDLWLHQDIATEPKLAELSVKTLEAEGGHRMLLLTPR